MDTWFVKTKALYYAEELISLLSDLVSEISKNKDKNFTENEVHALSNEFFNALNTKVSDLKKDSTYNDTHFLAFFQLAIVAMIDDVFLTMTWSGRQYWASYLLEMRVFSTRSAGDRFFDNAKTIMQSRDSKSKELAAIYHLCLTAGFRGRYYNVEYNREINTYRTDLYNAFNTEATESPDFANAAILPSGYIPNKSKDLLSQKYKTFNWLLMINFILIILFVIISYVVWFNSENLIFRNL